VLLRRGHVAIRTYPLFPGNFFFYPNICHFTPTLFWIFSFYPCLTLIYFNIFYFVLLLLLRYTVHPPKNCSGKYLSIPVCNFHRYTLHKCTGMCFQEEKIYTLPVHFFQVDRYVFSEEKINKVPIHLFQVYRYVFSEKKIYQYDTGTLVSSGPV
jgi:hypothetical protein